MIKNRFEAIVIASSETLRGDPFRNNSLDRHAAKPLAMTAIRFLSFSALCFTTICFADPTLTITPAKSLIDQPVKILVKGVPPKTPVEITAAMTDENGRTWQSDASYLSNARGVVNVATDAPDQGDYTGVHPMGLFWAMKLDPAAKDRSAFWQKSLNPMHVTFSVNTGEKTLTQTIERDIAAPGITKVTVRDPGFDANLFLPAGKGPFPAIMVLGGSEGGLPPDAYAVQFANHGYAALAVAYYKAPKLPQHFANIPIEYFGKALAWMRHDKRIDATRLGIVGSSTGGMAALLVASYYPQLQAVAVFNGSGVIFQSIDADGNTPESLFSYQGSPLPFIPVLKPDFAPDHFPSNFYLRLFLGSFLNASPDVVNAAEIPVESINGPILMMAGGNDELLGSANLLQVSIERLSTHGFSHSRELQIYNGVGSTLGVNGLPNTPTTVLTLPAPLAGQVINLGGDPVDTAKAQKDSWKRLWRFLREYVKQT